MADEQAASQAEDKPVKSATAARPQAEEDPRDKIARLRREAAEEEAKLTPGASTSRVRVEPPHSSFTVGSVTVSSEFSDVPDHALARLFSAADDAGVTLTQEG